MGFMAALPPLLAETSIIDLLEEHGDVVYPVAAVAVGLILLGGIIYAWRMPHMAGAEKARLKESILVVMRGRVVWMTARQVAEQMDADTHTVATLMEEMKRDGVLVSSIIEGNIHFRVKSPSS